MDAPQGLSLLDLALTIAPERAVGGFDDRYGHLMPGSEVEARAMLDAHLGKPGR